MFWLRASRRWGWTRKFPSKIGRRAIGSRNGENATSEDRRDEGILHVYLWMVGMLDAKARTQLAIRSLNVSRATQALHE